MDSYVGNAKPRQGRGLGVRFCVSAGPQGRASRASVQSLEHRRLLAIHCQYAGAIEARRMHIACATTSRAVTVRQVQ